MTTPADTNRVNIRYSQESSWGETPSGPAMTLFRAVSESLKHNKDTVVTAEIRATRDRPDILEVGQSADGDIAFELSYGNFEAFFQNALRRALSSATVELASVTVAASSITGPSGTDFVANFEAGQWIRVKAGSTNASGVVAQVKSLTSTVITTTGTTLTASVLTSAAITGRTIKNGTTKTSYLLEVENADASSTRYFPGMRVDSLSLDISSQQIVTGTFTFMGKRGYAASATVASATTSAGTQTPMTAAVNVGQIHEGGQKLTDAVQQITLQISNNMRARPQVGQKTSAEHGDGGIDVTGTANIYFADEALLQKFINHTETALAVQMKDADGNVAVLTVPSVYYSEGNSPTTGQDADVFLPLSFIGRRDPTDGFVVRFDFLPTV